MSIFGQALGLRQRFDADVAIPDVCAVVLETDVAFAFEILQGRAKLVL